MNSYIRKTILAVALVLAAFCVQACTKDGLTPEERLIERRERTFSSKDRIMSFYLNGNLVCDEKTWYRCNRKYWGGRQTFDCTKLESKGYLQLDALLPEKEWWYIAGGEISLGLISFDIPYENDEYLLDSIKVKASFDKKDYFPFFWDCPLSVSSMDFEIVEYDEGDSENRGYIMGRFSFNASYDFGAKENWPESVEFSVTDGMFNADLYIQKPL